MVIQSILASSTDSKSSSTIINHNQQIEPNDKILLYCNGAFAGTAKFQGNTKTKKLSKTIHGTSLKSLEKRKQCFCAVRNILLDACKTSGAYPYINLGIEDISVLLGNLKVVRTYVSYLKSVRKPPM